MDEILKQIEEALYSKWNRMISMNATKWLTHQQSIISQQSAQILSLAEERDAAIEKFVNTDVRLSAEIEKIKQEQNCLTDREILLILGWLFIIQRLPRYKFSDEENALIDKLTIPRKHIKENPHE